MVDEGIKYALAATQGDSWGQLAGDTVMGLAADRGLEAEGTVDIYGSILHHACLADILTTAVRKQDTPAWVVPEKVNDWTSGAFLSPDGSNLRRCVLASSWSDARHYSECRSWMTLGEIAMYELPMQLVVLIIGQQRDGRRHGAWTTGYRHPKNHELRFRKRQHSNTQEFNEKWERIVREEHAEITREEWLEKMLADDVLPNVCFKEDIEVPPPRQIARIKELAVRKLERLLNLKEIPEMNLSSCDFPVPCPFKKLCWALPERMPSKDYGYVRIK